MRWIFVETSIQFQNSLRHVDKCKSKRTALSVFLPPNRHFCSTKWNSNIDPRNKLWTDRTHFERTHWTSRYNQMVGRIGRNFIAEKCWKWSFFRRVCAHVVFCLYQCRQGGALESQSNSASYKDQLDEPWAGKGLNAIMVKFWHHPAMVAEWLA